MPVACRGQSVGVLVSLFSQSGERGLHRILEEVKSCQFLSMLRCLTG